MPLCMTVRIDVSIIKFKVKKFPRISEIINKELKFLKWGSVAGCRTVPVPKVVRRAS